METYIQAIIEELEKLRSCTPSNSEVMGTICLTFQDLNEKVSHTDEPVQVVFPSMLSEHAGEKIRSPRRLIKRGFFSIHVQ